MIPVRVNPVEKPLTVGRDHFDLAPDHPLYGSECPACGEGLHAVEGEYEQPDAWRYATVRTCLVLVGRAPDAGWTAGSVMVHEDCAR